MPTQYPTLTRTPSARVATRYIVRIEVVVTAGHQSQSASIIDLSDSGARLDGLPLGLPPGAPLELEFKSFGLEERVTLLARLVRDTPKGFAIRFLDEEPFLRLFLKLERVLASANDADASKELART